MSVDQIDSMLDALRGKFCSVTFENEVISYYLPLSAGTAYFNVKFEILYCEPYVIHRAQCRVPDFRRDYWVNPTGTEIRRRILQVTGILSDLYVVDVNELH